VNLNDFRSWSTDERNTWAANLIMCQHPRLRRGDDMNGPVGVFKNGKEWSSAQDPDYDPLLFLNCGATITARSINATQQQFFDLHPWLDLGIETSNYLHIYCCEERSSFGDLAAGAMIPVQYADRKIRIPLTQQMIDDSTSILIRFGLST